jgi:hypothetical protein
VQARDQIGYIKLIQGRWSDDARNLAVTDVPPVRGRAGGILYILVELSGDVSGREQLAERLANAAQQAYLASAGSFTLGLRRAVEAANTALFQANVAAPVEQRRYGGISCVVVSDSDVYIGQAGPALVYALHGEGVRPFPFESPWLATSGEPPASPEALDGTTWVPLGVRRELEVNLFHCRMEPGDVICLATSNLAQLVRQDDLELILDQELEDSLRDLLTVAEGEDVTVLLVQKPSLGEPDEELAALAEHPAIRGPGWVARGRQTLGQLKVRRRLRALGAAIAGFLLRLLPDRETQPLPPVEEEQKRRVLAGIALLIPSLIAILTLTFYLQQGNRFDNLMEQARQEIAQAQTADAATAEALLRSATLHLDNALQIRPDDEEARRLKAEVEMALEQVQGLTRLADLQPLVEFAPSSRLKRVWAAQANLYVLDLGLQQVMRVPLTQPGEAVAQLVLVRGEVLDGRTVSELVDAAWVLRPGGADGRLGVLDREGVLWLIEPQGPVAQPLPGADGWGQPIALSSFEGNVYVLDAGRDEIWKYVPTTAGFTAPPVAWLESQTSLTSAVDMAIDGAIYVLDADGTIRKFAAGRRVGFAVQGLDRPFKDPVALFTTPQAPALYVVDAGNRRVVELSKEGAFRRQWMAPLASHALDELRGLFVDQAASRVYLLSGSRLYVATLP